MPEGSLRIGAIIDLEQLKAGFDESGSIVKQSAEAMGVSFQQLSSKIEAVEAKISTDTREAAAVISGEWRKVGEANAAFVQSQEQVRAALRLVTLTAGQDAQAIDVLGAARARAAAASLEYAAAQKAVVVAEEEEITVASALREVMSGFSEILGVAIGLELFKRVIKDTAEATIQLGHLSEKTGIAAKTLAGLRAVAERTGTDFEALGTGMVRLLKAQEQGVQGGKAQAVAFADIGLKISDVRNLSPEDLFFRVAEAMATTESHAARAAAAIGLLGKAGASSIPMLVQYGGALREAASAAGELSGVTEESVANANRFKEVDADLTEQWHSVTIPVMEFVAKVLKGWEVIIVGLRLVFHQFSITFVTGFRDIVEGAVGVTKALLAVSTFDVSGAKQALKAMADGIADNNNLAAQRVVENWVEAGAKIKAIMADPPGDFAGGDKGPPPPGPGKGDKGLSVYQAQLDKMNEARNAFHQVSAAEEVTFWEHVLNTQRLSAKQQEEIIHKLVELKKRAAQEAVKEAIAEENTKEQAYKVGGAERLQAEKNKLEILRAAGAEGTREFIDQQGRIAAAQREFDAQQNREAVAAEARKVEATKHGTIERLNEERIYLALVKNIYGEESSEYQAALGKMDTASREFHQQQIRAADEEIRHEQEMNELKVQGDRQTYNAQIAGRLRTNAQILAEEQRFAQQEHAIKQQALQAKIQLLAKDPDLNKAELQRLHNQIEEEDRRFENKISQIKLQSVNYRKQLEQSLIGNLQTGFASAIQGMLTANQSFAQDLKSLYDGIASTFANALSQMLTNWITTHVIMKVLGITNAQTTNAAEATSAAGLAAANSFAWWSAVDPPIAPAMAAASFAEGLAWAGVAGSAAGGAVLDKDMPIFAHAKEMILPARISEGLQSMIGMGGVPTLPGVGDIKSGRGGGGGDVHHTHVFNGGPTHIHVHAMDADSVNQQAAAIGHKVSEISMRRMKRYMATSGVIS